MLFKRTWLKSSFPVGENADDAGEEEPRDEQT
jgi:hypothetical protein